MKPAFISTDPSQFLNLLLALDRSKQITVDEHFARHLRPGSYIQHEGLIWKVTKKVYPTLWTDETVTLVIVNAPRPKADLTAKVAWLEDRLMPRLAESA